MKFAMIAAVLITLPAIAGFFYGLIFGPRVLMFAALASLALNSLPFLVAGLMMRHSGGDGADLGH